MPRDPLRLLPPAAALIALLGLAGCADPTAGGAVDASAAAGPAAADPGLDPEADEAASAPSGIIAGMAQPDRPNCPPVQILEGTAAYRGNQPIAGATGVAFQASLADVARECRFDGANMTISVGVRGRVLLGTAGRAGSFTVPVRVVVRRGETVNYSNLTRVPIAVPEGQTQIAFQHVEQGIVVPQGPDGRDTYDILVGFDPRERD